MSNHTKTGGEALVYENRAEGMHVISPECGKVLSFGISVFFLNSILLQAFQDMKLKRKSRYIIFKIGEEQIDVEKLGARTATFEDLKKDLPYTDSRYVVFDQEFTTHDGRQTSKLWFISWFPNNSTPYNKMAYTVKLMCIDVLILN